jgi:serine/threonine-protein kinase
MDSRSSQIPSNIGRFRIEALLGSGGMGEVYKAFDPTLQRTVAVKTVRPDIDRPEFLERLYREAQACARLQHPNIVTVFEAGEFNGIVYIAMEYLKGDSLNTVLRRGELTFDAKLRILVQILDALQHAHSEDVIHRDIKPSNVNRQPDGSIKLLDFGLARMVRAETMTMSGAIMGTPHYASPEQLRGERVDARTDIYSTGALAYEMLSGRRPFEADNDSVATILFKVLSENPAPMDTSWSRRFPEIQDIVTKAMAKAPEDRYQSAAEMRDAINAFATTQREAITIAITESQQSAQHTVLEAKNLMAGGLKLEAQTLLESALRNDPDASAVRTMLDESRTPPPLSRPPSASPATPFAPAPVFDAGAGGVTPMPVTPSSPPTPYVTRDLSKPTPTPTPAPLPMPPPRPMPKALWWAMGGAAILAIATGIALNRDRLFGDDTTTVAAVTPSTPPIATDPAASGAAPVGERPPGAPATGTPSAPAATSAAAIPPAAPPATPPPADPGAKPATPSAASPPPATPTAPGAEPTPAKPPAPRPSAKQLYTAGAGAGASSASANAGLKYRVIQDRGGIQVDSDPDTTFRAGDRVKFAFESNIDGFLYVVYKGSSGRWDVLFPNPEINGGRNTIRRGQQYAVPEDGWFAFDETPGTEEVFVILSKEPMAQLPGFKSPVTKAESIQAAVVDTLQQEIRSRDLVFEKERPTTGLGGRVTQASYVVNPDELGKAVTASIRLIHK